ncbi:MAG: DUF4180 domain-containing protein, partial [Coprobacillus cateniformis]
ARVKRHIRRSIQRQIKRLIERNIYMNLSKIENKGTLCALVNCENTVITDTQSALDLLMSAKYDIGTKNIVISKQLITEDFFVLSTGLAGEILQKFVNYGGRIAIYGDYSHYTSKPLRDFIYESNNGNMYFLHHH